MTDIPLPARGGELGRERGSKPEQDRLNSIHWGRLSLMIGAGTLVLASVGTALWGIGQMRGLEARANNKELAGRLNARGIPADTFHVHDNAHRVIFFCEPGQPKPYPFDMGVNQHTENGLTSVELFVHQPGVEDLDKQGLSKGSELPFPVNNINDAHALSAKVAEYCGYIVPKDTTKK